MKVNIEKAIDLVNRSIDPKIAKYCVRDFIIKSLLKQKPMLVRIIHVDEYECPACGAENNCDEHIVNDLYCPNCGQRICTKTEDKKHESKT